MLNISDYNSTCIPFPNEREMTIKALIDRGMVEISRSRMSTHSLTKGTEANDVLACLGGNGFVWFDEAAKTYWNAAENDWLESEFRATVCESAREDSGTCKWIRMS